MSMPRGYKSENGYATVTSEYGGADYRTIAEKMTSDGHKMNHATARNIFLRAMKKLADPLCKLHGISDDKLIEQAARDPSFQESMIEIVSDIYSENFITAKEKINALEIVA
tara:strand:- start:156 stop:488 length:333 start_codon:yes stop_codon:yes gene_type:complete